MSLLRVNEIHDLNDQSVFKVTDQISSNFTINVPEDFPTISAAFDNVRTKRIINGSIVTIKVADGTQTITSPVSLNHPQGNQIRLIGNQATPANCIITCSDAYTGDGLVCSGGSVIGLIDGFTITRPNKSVNTINTTGILAVQNSTVICGPNIRVSKWYYGIAARNNAYVECRGVIVDQAGDVGIWAFNGSSVDCQNATSTNASDSANNLGYGIQAEYGSFVECSGASASGNLVGGIAAINGGTVRAHNSNASNNTGSGYYIREKSHIAINGGIANNNSGWGLNRFSDATSSGTATLNSNVLGANKPVAFFDNDVVNGALRSNTGAPLRLGSTGSDGVRLEVAGNIAIQCGTLGAGTAVNFAQFDAGLTGNPVEFKARGNDTNIDLQLSPKGTGSVRIGTFTTNADAPVIGYITIKDTAGNIRKLAVIA